MVNKNITHEQMKTNSSSEKYIERKINEYVKNIGGLSIKLNSVNFNGLPDRLCLLPAGNLLFIEVKTTGEKTRKLQEYIHKKIRQLGFKVVVIDNVDEIEKTIKNE